MKTLILVAAIGTLVLTGCDNNVSAPTAAPEISLPATRTLQISAVVEQAHLDGSKNLFELTGTLEYSVVELRTDDRDFPEAAALSYRITVALRADLKDRVTQDAWQVIGSYSDELAFSSSCKKCFTKAFAIQSMIQVPNLNVEFELVNNNIFVSQAWITP